MSKNIFGWDENDLRAEFNSNADLVPAFQAAADEHSFQPARLWAIASRETSLNHYYRTHPGDGGHGFGPMQIDIGSYPAFCNSPDWEDPARAIMKGAEVLASKLQEAASAGLTGDDAIRVAIAGYNGGTRRAIECYNAGEDVDTHTTHHNYSADVLTRVPYFQQFLDEYGQLQKV